MQELKGATTKAQTDYTYDLDSNVLSTNAQRFADPGTGSRLVGRYTGYTWDVLNLVATVKAGTSPTATLDTWSYTYDGRGLRSTVTKPNGNVATFTYHEDGLQRILTEKTSSGQLVTSHSLRYNADGDRSQDVERVLKAKTAEYLDQASIYAYTPARQLETATKTGADKGESESYKYDAAGNTIEQKIGATTSTMTYERNRLVKTVTGGATLNYRYDPFGRSTTADVGTQVVEQNAYDGYDRLVRQQKFDTAGNPTFTRNQTYDAFDRVTNQSEKVGIAQSISTRYTFIGLADQIAIEEEKDTNGVWKTSKSYAYGAGGENLSLIDSPVNGTTSTKSFYGTNPHGDTETLTDATTGATTSTYRYTAYGQPDKIGTTGDDEIKNDATADADIVNPYRFNSSRYDGATGTYDMGFREYNPGLNRFLTRDMFNGALQDLALGADPWNANRYMFGSGNPITRVEYDGHCAFDPETESACGRPVKRVLGSGSNPPPEPETKPTEPSTIQKISNYVAPGQFEKNVTNDLVVKPIQETYEACKAAVTTAGGTAPGSASWQQCQMGAALTVLGFTGGGKIVGVGVRSLEGMAAARAEAAGASLLFGRTAAKTADEVVEVTANAPKITFGHGARHLEGTGLGVEEVESTILQRVTTATSQATSETGSFWGRVQVRGTTIEYRAYTLPDGTINVGTYYVP